MALRWQDKKASYLHLVDLDGALAGRSVNEEVIKEIVRAVDIPVQLGGGIRSAETVERMLLNGIARVIIGTKAVERPEFMRELVERFGPERGCIGSPVTGFPWWRARPSPAGPLTPRRRGPGPGP